MEKEPYVATPEPKGWPRNALHYLYAFWAMGRPLFLLGTLPLYLLGVAAAWHGSQTLRVPLLVGGLVLAWLVQLMTHYNNEYNDLDTDLATEVPTRISGGSRVLVRGLILRRMARAAGLVSLSLALALAIVLTLVLDAGKLTLALAGTGILLGWFYSAPPLKLVSRGTGEAAIIAVSCWLLPNLSYYLQTSSFSRGLLVVCIPLSFLTFALTLATELPDMAADKATAKMTLVARLGRSRTARLHNTVFAVGWLASSAWIIYAWPAWGWVAAATSTLLAALHFISIRGLSGGDVVSMERVGLIDSLLLAYTAISFSIAFVLS